MTLEGTLVLDDFDLYAAAGAAYTAYDRSFSATVTDGTLNITFTTVLRNAVVNAIQVEWAGTAPPTPVASYVYRGDGLRHSKTAGGSTTTYTWDVNRDVSEVLQDGTSTYVYGHGLVSQTDGSGTQTYVLADGLGSTRTLTDGSGSVTASYAYDVFGAVRSSTGAGSTDYRFTGEFDDSTTSLTYLRARWYDPSTGRFLSKDPFPGFAVVPSSQHAYAYVQNNPVNAVDPSGKYGGRAIPYRGGIGRGWEDPFGGAGTWFFWAAAAGVATAWANLDGEVGDTLSALWNGCTRAWDDLTTWFSKGGASDKSLKQGVMKKAREWQKDVDELEQDPNGYGAKHHGDTKRGHEQSIRDSLEKMGPKARKETIEELTEEYPRLAEEISGG